MAGVESPPHLMSAFGYQGVHSVTKGAGHHSQKRQGTPRKGQLGGDSDGGVAPGVQPPTAYQGDRGTRLGQPPVVAGNLAPPQEFPGGRRVERREPNTGFPVSSKQELDRADAKGTPAVEQHHGAISVVDAGHLARSFGS